MPIMLKLFPFLFLLSCTVKNLSNPRFFDKVTEYPIFVQCVDSTYTYYNIFVSETRTLKIDTLKEDRVVLRFFYWEKGRRVYFDPCDKPIGTQYFIKD